MTRITLATYDDDPPEGGQGVLVRGMREALVRAGVDVTTVAGRGAHAVDIPRRTGRAPLDLSIRLARHPESLLRSRPDVVHAMGGPGGVLLVRRLPVPLVYTANHTYAQAHPLTSPKRALSLLERRVYRRAARVLCISASTADAVRRLGVPADRVELLMPGVDVARLDAGAADTAREPFRLLFAGRLTPEKRPLDAVAAMVRLCTDDGRVRGTVVGRGPLESAVRAAAAAAPRSAVEVLGGVDDAGLAREYARASVVLIPSAYEGLGLVALEAMAMGAAVVAADVTGLRDAVGEEGLLVTPADVGALATVVAALLADEPRRADLAAAGRERVRRRHGWDAAATRLVSLYRELAAG